MHLVEQMGLGIGRIRELMSAAELPVPVFQKEGMFTVVFPRREKSRVESRVESRVKSRVKSREKILELINSNPWVTTQELAEQVGISVKAIEKQIRNLKNEGIIERIGPNKGGEWRVIITAGNK